MAFASSIVSRSVLRDMCGIAPCERRPWPKAPALVGNARG